MTPKVTILIPVYNGAAYLREALDSVIHQTLQDIEILICNNGSTDNTLEIAEEYAAKDERIVIRTHENLGQGPNLVDGLKIARGEYIGEVDADDFVDPEMYAYMYSVASSTNADVVKGSYIEFGSGWSMQCPVAPPNLCDLTISISALPQKMKNALIGRPPCIFCGLYNREFLLKNELFFRADKNYEDTSLAFKIAVSARRWVWINRSFYHHRADNPNSGTNTLKDFEAIVEQFDEMRRFDAEHKTHLRQWINTMSYYTFLWMLGRCHTDVDRQVFFSIMRREFRKHKVGAEFFNTTEDYEAYCLVRGEK